MKRGPNQWLLVLTEALNALLWGDAHHSFSARAGYALYRGKRWAKVVVPIIDFILRNSGHCTDQARIEGLIPTPPAE